MWNGCRYENKSSFFFQNYVRVCILLVVTPVNKIVYKDKVFSIGEAGSTTGPAIKKLYDGVRSVQFGETPDTLNWMVEIE